MPFDFNIIPATFNALAKLVQVLDQHRFGAVILILVMTIAGASMAVPYLPLIMA